MSKTNKPLPKKVKRPKKIIPKPRGAFEGPLPSFMLPFKIKK